jgi:hypothetical protein
MVKLSGIAAAALQASLGTYARRARGSENSPTTSWCALFCDSGPSLGFVLNPGRMRPNAEFETVASGGGGDAVGPRVRGARKRCRPSASLPGRGLGGGTLRALREMAPSALGVPGAGRGSGADCANAGGRPVRGGCLPVTRAAGCVACERSWALRKPTSSRCARPWQNSAPKSFSPPTALRPQHEDQNTPLPFGHLSVLAHVDPSAVLSRPDVAQALRLATARVVDSDSDRYEGLRGVMVGRAYSIAYQELGPYDESNGSLLGWLSQKVQAGLRKDFA